MIEFKILIIRYFDSSFLYSTYFIGHYFKISHSFPSIPLTWIQKIKSQFPTRQEIFFISLNSLPYLEKSDLLSRQTQNPTLRLPLPDPGKGKNKRTGSDDVSEGSPIYLPVNKEMISMAGMVVEFS
jgi:hypothetical protein